MLHKTARIGWLILLLTFSLLSESQVTKTISGVVTHKPGHKQAKFETPAGTITTNIPDDILPGETFKGTVIREPAGKNKKEIERNLVSLGTYLLQFEGGKIPINDQTSFVQSVPNNVHATNADWTLKLVDPKTSASASLSWKSNPAGAITQEAGNTNGRINMNAYSSGDRILWSNPSKQFQPSDQFSLTGNDNKVFSVDAITQSTRESVLQIPEHLATGYYAVSRKSVDGNIIEQKNIAVFDLQLSSPNTNLTSGQRSNIQARIVVPERGWTDHALPYSFRIDLQNISPNTVSMQGGEMQRVILPSNHNWQNRNSWMLQRTITGIKPGAFSVNATLYNDINVSNDPFLPQLSVLKSSADLNRWTSVLKQDLANYARMQPADQAGKAISSNAKRAIDNMPNCENMGGMEECKQFIQMLLRPLNIPKSAASVWLSGYEAYKIGIPEMSQEIFDAGLIKNGLSIIGRIGKAMKDPAIIGNLINSNRTLEDIERSEPIGIKINALKNELMTLNMLVDSRLGKDPYDNYSYPLKDINSISRPVNYPDRSINIKNSIVGFLDPIKKVLMVTPDFVQPLIKSLQGVEQPDGSYRIQSTTLNGAMISYLIRILAVPQTAVYDEHEWRVKYLTEKKQLNPDTPPIIGLSKDSSGTWYRFFKDAECETDGRELDYDCFEGDDLIRHDDGTHEWKKNGVFSKVHFTSINQCKKGESFCTEVYQVWRIQYIYDDKKCTVLRSVKTDYEFGCK